MAFTCGYCQLALTTKPERSKIPDAWHIHLKGEVFANGVFIPCGHVFHLGCMSQAFFNQMKRRTGAAAVCPTCKVSCPSSGSHVTVKRLFPVIQKEEKSEDSDELDAVAEKKPPTADVSPDCPDAKPSQPMELYSLRHAAVALFLFALVIQSLYYQLRHADKSDAADIEDEDILDPHWIQQFYASLSAGALFSCVAAFLFDKITES